MSTHSTFVSPSVDYGSCMACECPLRAYYRTSRMQFCAIKHWRHYLVARVVERQLLNTSELTLWTQCIRTASTADVLMLLVLFGDKLVSQVDDIDRRPVSEIIRSAEAA
jgi:hypothetical protein